MRAALKLCKVDAHPNIVPVFAHGQLPFSSIHYLDMELCDLNLEKYIHRGRTTSLQTPFNAAEMSPQMQMFQVWEIMENITNGVAFIHDKGEVHRDLKPRNGT
jgi:serine/threonine protein kinase